MLEKFQVCEYNLDLNSTYFFWEGNEMKIFETFSLELFLQNILRTREDGIL